MKQHIGRSCVRTYIWCWVKAVLSLCLKGRNENSLEIEERWKISVPGKNLLELLSSLSTVTRSPDFKTLMQFVTDYSCFPLIFPSRVLTAVYSVNYLYSLVQHYSVLWVIFSIGIMLILYTVLKLKGFVYL